MMDSGIRSGTDISRAIASGADFTFLGRSFMYGVSALGRNGGDHTISILMSQLTQVMEQMCCENPLDSGNNFSLILLINVLKKYNLRLKLKNLNSTYH